MTLAALPWKTLPQQRDRVKAVEFQGGVLEIPMLGYVTTDELALVGEVDRKNEVFRLTSDAAVRVAQADDGAMPAHVVFGILTRIQGAGAGIGTKFDQAEDELCARHGAILAPYLKACAAVNRQLQTRQALVILQRLEACAGWGEDEVRALPGALEAQLSGLFAEEQWAMGGGPSPEEALRSLEADLGKLRPGESWTATDPTGEPSTGSFAASSPAPPSLTPSGSVRSRGAMSSKPSRRDAIRNGAGFTSAS